VVLVAAAVLTAASAVLVAGGTSAPDAACYMVLYAAQDEGNNPTTSHCFATFARVSRSGTRPVELHHINWFSVRGHQTGSTCLFDAEGQPARPEPGENRTTAEALALARRVGLRVTRWGPYEIDRALFERALRQIDLLEGRIPGRKVLYKAMDLGLREGPEVRVLDCIHAVSDIDRDPVLLRTWTSYGEEAGRKVVQHLGRWIKGQGREHPEVWGPIWEAMWRGTPAAAAPEIVRGEAPWKEDSHAAAGGRTGSRAGGGG
jgi:hypothetical protein